MPFPNCDNRADPANRQKLATAYTITPVAHVKLLPGQALKGCCGLIKDECYTFSYSNNSSAADIGLFSVGSHCAEDFLMLIKKIAPPCFNPLTSASSGGSGSSSGSSLPAMCSLNREVYQAINLLTLDWGPPKASLQAILIAIAFVPATPIPVNDVLHLNNIIGKDRHGRTLTAIIAALKGAHPNLRSFTFSNISGMLSQRGKTSNF